MGSRFKNVGEAVSVKSPGVNIHPEEFSAGDPVVYGFRPAIAMTERRINPETRFFEPVNTTLWYYGIYEDVDVKRANAVTIGQELFFESRGISAPYLTDDGSDTDSIHWGYAGEDKAAGTGPMKVWLGY